MSYAVKLIPIVYKELRESKKWYNLQKYGLGDEFKEIINLEIEFIAKNPKLHQKKYNNLYQCVVKRFPFTIFYLIDDKMKLIVVFGVLHTKRNPEIIRKRKNR